MMNVNILSVFIYIKICSEKLLRIHPFSPLLAFSLEFLQSALI